MKKHYYLYILIALIMTASAPLVVRAEDGSDDAMSDDTQTNAQVQTPRPGAPVPTLLREQLRNKSEGIQNNIEVRNKILENRRTATGTGPTPRMIASTTREDHRERIMEVRREDRDDMRTATNTMERREIRREMHKDVFQIRKDAIIKQITVAINNLKQIRERIASRIEKAVAAGRDMTNAKQALTVADTKIQVAIDAVEAFKAYTPTQPTSATSTDQVNLDKPRQVAETAQKAIKDAQQSLVAVIRAIAHAMGLGDQASTTPATSTTTI